MALTDDRTVGTTRVTNDRSTMPSGVAFAVLFVLGMILGSNTPESDQPDAEWTQWFDDSGNRTMQIVSLFLLVLAGVAFVVFITGLARRLRAQSGGDDQAAHVAHGAGLVLGAVIAIGGVAKNQISGAIEFGDLPLPSPEILRTAEQLGYGIILVAGGMFASLTVAATSIAARHSAVLPRWLVTAGYVVAVILLLSVAWIPMVLLPLWALAVAFSGGRSNNGDRTVGANSSR